MIWSARRGAKDGKPERQRMSELIENSPRLSRLLNECDLQYSPFRFVAAAMFGWLLASTPSIKTAAENKPANFASEVSTLQGSLNKRTDFIKP